VRRIAFGLGDRYRLHCADLPGKPDLVFRPRRKVIFVHGCFWHLHPKQDCKDARRPKTNTAYWTPKLARNVVRDKELARELKRQGWKILVVWECETRDAQKLRRRIAAFLGST
jgi:DNA mismatch endonuclease (patch repair protein)